MSIDPRSSRTPLLARRTVASIAAVVALAVPAKADAVASKREVHAMRRCDQQHVRACILRAALHRGQSPSYMRAVAYCESRFNPYAYNHSSGAAGLYQFLASTWAGTPYARYPRTSAKWSALAAGWMWVHGRRGEWECA